MEKKKHDPQADATAPLVTRNDQLTMKASGKEARRQTVAANKKKRKSKGSKGKKKSRNKKQRHNDGKTSNSMQKSPSKRKLQVLKQAKGSGGEEGVDQEGEQSKHAKKKKGVTGKAKKEAEPAKSSPSVLAGTPKAKAKAKAKAKTAPAAKPKAKGKAAKDKQESAKGADKPRRSRKKQDLSQQELYDEKIVEKLCVFARSVSDFSRDVKTTKFKSFVRAQLCDLEWTSLNIYWTRCGCGVTETETGRDLNNFSFNSSEACESHRIACAVKCGELAASRLTCDYTFLYFPKGLYDLDIYRHCFSHYKVNVIYH